MILYGAGHPISSRHSKAGKVYGSLPTRQYDAVSSDTAHRTAEKLATTKAGVVAFATSGDPELGEYDEGPTIIFKAGRLPAPFEEA